MTFKPQPIIGQLSMTRQLGLLVLLLMAAIATGCSIKPDPSTLIEPWKIEPLPAGGNGSLRFRLATHTRKQIEHSALLGQFYAESLRVCRHDSFLESRRIKPANPPESPFDAGDIHPANLEIVFEIACPGALPNENIEPLNREYADIKLDLAKRLGERIHREWPAQAVTNTWTGKGEGKHAAFQRLLGNMIMHLHRRCGDGRIQLGDIATSVRIEPFEAVSNSIFSYAKIPPIEEYEGRLEIFVAAELSCMQQHAPSSAVSAL